MSKIQRLARNGYKIAYEALTGRSPTIVFCPGFNSSMYGNKATALHQFCQSQGLAFVRFDYMGHGESTGDFADGCITTWLHDTLAIIDEVAEGEIILVGSSMGGWISLLASLQRPRRVAGLLLLACAADMTAFYDQRLAGLQAQVDDAKRAYFNVPSSDPNEPPYRIYQKLLDDGAEHYVLPHSIPIKVPVRLIHGMQDEVIEWQRSQQIVSQLESSDVCLSLVKNGDHRLSQDCDLAMMLARLIELMTCLESR